MFEKEKIIKEKRLAEATTKEFIGLEGKFGCILKYLGKPILEQGTSDYHATPFIDVWDLPDEDTLPTLDQYEPTTEMGFFFDGLPYGMHLEIRYIDEEKNLTVHYKGYMVYSEQEGDLLCFVPHKEWEDQIERLLTLAKKEESKYKINKNIEDKTEKRREKLSFFDKLKKEWGFDIWS